tara:strand:- start:92 stop:400 length:309 start_codon:yes stop_codon:yes gene_type:complete
MKLISLKEITNYIGGLITTKSDKCLIIAKGSQSGKYIIRDEIKLSEYMIKYKLSKNGNNFLIYIQDYRNADFMVEKFYSASMINEEDGSMCSIQPEDMTKTE